LDFKRSECIVFTIMYVFFSSYQHILAPSKNATIFDMSIFSNRKVNLDGALKASQNQFLKKFTLFFRSNSKTNDLKVCLRLTKKKFYWSVMLFVVVIYFQFILFFFYIFKFNLYVSFNFCWRLIGQLFIFDFNKSRFRLFWFYVGHINRNRTIGYCRFSFFNDFNRLNRNR